MFENVLQVVEKQKAPKSRPIQFGPWTSGLVTRRQAEQLMPDEASEILNFVLFDNGIPRTRPGTVQECEGVNGSIVDAMDAIVGGNLYTFMTAFGTLVGGLYINIDGQAVHIGNLEGEGRLENYSGMLVVADGDTLKYVDNAAASSWSVGITFERGDVCVVDGYGYKAIKAHTADDSNRPGTGASWPGVWKQNWMDVVYDGGTGPDSYQWNNRTGLLDTTFPLGSHADTRVAQLFTSQEWNSGYGIPVTTFYVWLSSTGSPTGTLWFRLRREIDDTVIAEVELADASEVPTTDPAEFSVALLPEDIYLNMMPETLYRACVEWDGGGASDHILVHASDEVSKYPVNGNVSTWDGNAWTEHSGVDLVGAMGPGTGPMLRSTVVFGSRLFGIEGVEGFHPAWIWYTDAGNLFDWSTPDGGGYIEVMDKNAYTFPVGAIAVFYQSLYIFGTPVKPFFSQLQGVSPSQYVAEPTLQKVSGNYRSVVVTTDDIYFRHKSGVDAISTIQAYGDLAAVSQTDAINNILDYNFSEMDIAGYEPTHGLYLLKPAEHDFVYAIHCRMKSVRRMGLMQYPFSPATRWDMRKLRGTVTCFGRGVNKLYVGTTSGRLYRIDDHVVQDDDNDLDYRLVSNYQTTSFGELQTVKVNQIISGKYGAAFKLKFMVNHSRQQIDELDFDLPWDTSAPVADMRMDVDEMGWDVMVENYYDRDYLNFNFRALMVSIDDVKLNGEHLLLGPVSIMCNQIGGF